ncbi:MAG: hypothetical protein V2A79_09860 [Planctomycetota bacterium]
MKTVESLAAACQRTAKELELARSMSMGFISYGDIYAITPDDDLKLVLTEMIEAHLGQKVRRCEDRIRALALELPESGAGENRAVFTATSDAQSDIENQPSTIINPKKEFEI